MRPWCSSLALLLLAGCAAAPPTPERAAQLDEVDLCLAQHREPFGTDTWAVLSKEMARRGTDCSRWRPGLQAHDREQAEMAAQDARDRDERALRAIESLPRPVNCTSSRVGSQVFTRCQ